MGSAICGYVGKRYHVRVRRHGQKRYEIIGKPTRSFNAAVVRLAKTFAATYDYKRGDVLMTADYYDAVQLCEITR